MTIARGALIAGKYRLEDRLAVGGMGSVWRARHVLLGVPVAVKFMDPSHVASPVAQRRFELEARAAAAISSPNVVHVSDYGVDGPVPYIVMELLLGEDLGRRLARKTRLSLRAVARIVEQAANGLAKTHELGIVHRDLKPSNIFLARVGDEEIVKIVDFGIAKDMAATDVGESTKTGELMGSPHFMSPEQIRGAKDLDGRSDAWSLAVIAFRALTGQLPFGGEGLGAVLGKVLADPVVHATEVAPDLPEGIDEFFVKCFERDRDKRFATATAMADAFIEVASRSSLSMRPSEPPPMLPDSDVLSDAPKRPRPPRPKGAPPPLPREARTSDPPTSSAPPPFALTPTTEPTPFLFPPSLEAGAATEPTAAKKKPWALGAGAVALIIVAVVWSTSGSSPETTSAPTAAPTATESAPPTAIAAAPAPTAVTATPPAIAAPTASASSTGAVVATSKPVAAAAQDRSAAPSTPKKNVPSRPASTAASTAKPSWGF